MKRFDLDFWEKYETKDMVLRGQSICEIQKWNCGVNGKNKCILVIEKSNKCKETKLEFGWKM